MSFASPIISLILYVTTENYSFGIPYYRKWFIVNYDLVI